MKIFSLQSKTNLVVWSIVLGSVIDYFCINLITYTYYRYGALDELGPSGMIGVGGSSIVKFYGWPFSFHFDATSQSQLFSNVPAEPIGPQIMAFMGDLLFWILIVFIILSIIRYFGKKKV